MFSVDSPLTPLGVQQARAVHEMWSSEVGLVEALVHDTRPDDPQIPFGIPVPTVFYSSPHSRATRTLEITWTGITLPNTSNDYPLYPSHKVVIAEVRSCHGMSNSFELTLGIHA